MFKLGKLTPADLTQSKSSSTSTSNLLALTFSVLAEHPERMPLFLPSQMPTSLWQTGCAPGLVEKEKRLRVAQADDALSELRRLLRISSTIRDYKQVQVGGTSQKMNTKMQDLLERFHRKVMHCARRYTAAYNALSALDPNGEWAARLQYLDMAKDIRSPHRDRDGETARGKVEVEGTRRLSWIWLTQLPTHVLTEIDDSMRVEWAKSHARAMQWGEEVVLISEEMRRVIQYLDWKSGWWMNLICGCSDAKKDVHRGQAAYANKQGAMYRKMAHSFAEKWYPLTKKYNRNVEWLTEYIPNKIGRAHV